MKSSLLIIVPTLNSHNLLPKLVTSLQSQSWPYWQVMFIDGPSDPKHRLWLHQCCLLEPRCSWVPQDAGEKGIFGAMNQGFVAADAFDWLLFWGSDDWAYSSTVFEELFTLLDKLVLSERVPDLLVTRGRYVCLLSGMSGRISAFHSSGLLNSSAFRRSLLFGSTPPHQSTLFGIGARQRLSKYSSNFKLSADLDYFLKISLSSNLCVQCLDLDLVCMGDGGVSGQQTLRRLKEVRLAYRRAFFWYWWFPFTLRYVRRFASLFLRYR